jgi:3-carboxy-cis,cis-muconate cycloisomerase
MSGSAFGHPVLGGLVGDDEIATIIGFEAEMAAMAAFETALAEAEAEHDVIPADAPRKIAETLARFRPDVARLREATARDGVVVPELVRQMREAVGKPHAEHLHFGATSQDVADTAFVLRLKPALSVLDARLQRIGELFDELRSRFGPRTLTGLTRMQVAVPITAGDRLDSWSAPVARDRSRLHALMRSILAVQFGGAAGTLDRLGGKGHAVRKSLAARLQLQDAPQWHSQRDRPAELGSWLASLAGCLGKFGQDVALMALDGGEIALSGGGASSAMAHKQNPIAAEMLVTLARFNAVQVSGMHQSLVHEAERSGAAWTLEWLILPQMLMATAASTRIALRLLGSIERLGKRDG